MSTAGSTASPASAGALRLWVSGDWNGFFGLFTNVLLNVIVLTGLCLGVVQLPADTVFGRILPAMGIALLLGNAFYAYLAWQLGKAEGRSNVTAMPYGPSVPHMFIVVFLIMLPVYLKTKDPVLAWQAGLAWCFIIGIIVLLGAFVGPKIRSITPRAAMLGTLAGISVAFISMRPAFQMWETPWIGLVCFAIVLISWTANIRMPGGLPGGLVAVIIGTLIGWVVALAGWSDYVKPAEVGASFAQFGLRIPLFSSDVWTGLSQIAPLLVTAIPLGIYNFTEAMNNVESAAAAGDEYNLRKVLLADGAGALIGSMMGSPFPPAVYIGHPGWKAVGGRVGYSLATGIAIAVVCFLGLTALLLAVIPLVAILPILLYIGLVIGAQAFQASPANHAPAVVLALIPNIAEWAKTQIDGALAAAGTSVGQVGLDKLAGTGVLYHGLETLGGGSVLAGMVLGAIAAFIVDHRLRTAAIWAFVGAVLAFIGLIHGSQLGWAVSPLVAFGYVLFGVVCLALSKSQPQPAG
ncbi:MAG TPA: xanthine permease [Burkholderiaceae bacterium]|nr:xanthine permease [Burkholderiaceae bacterium]